MADSRKISAMPPKATLLDTDEFTILDRDGGVPLAQINKRVLKTVAFQGIATDSDVAAVQTDLDAHKLDSGVSAHPDTSTLTDLNNHKAANDQHTIVGVTGLTAELAAKANIADLGAPAFDDYGTTSGTVAEGNRPQDVMDTHETAFNHDNIQLPEQKAAADASSFPSGSNPYVTNSVLDSYLTAVIDDPNPILGGDLNVGGASNYVISYTDATGTEVGASGYDSIYDGTFLAYTPDGTFDENDGALLCSPGSVTVYGAEINLNALNHSDPLGYQLLCVTETGVVFSVSPPPTGWSNTDTGTHRQQLTGTGTTWIRVSDLNCTVQDDVSVGERLDIAANIYIENLSSSRGGTVSVGFGINGAQPAVVARIFATPGGFSGYLAFSLSTTTHGGLVATDEISFWCRRETQEHGQFDPYIAGDIDIHEATISVPGGGSGGGSPTNITITQTDANNVVFDSSTGLGDTMVPATQSAAGGMSATDKAKVDLGTADRSQANPVAQEITTHLDGRAYTVQLNNDENVTTWTAGPGTGGGGNASLSEYTCTVDFLPPAAGGAVNVSIPGTWKFAGNLSAISLSPGDEIITGILRSRADATIQIYLNQES